MGTTTTPVTRLERALTHGRTPISSIVGMQGERDAGAQRPPNGTGPQNPGQTETTRHVTANARVQSTRRQPPRIFQIGLPTTPEVASVTGC